MNYQCLNPFELLTREFESNKGSIAGLLGPGATFKRELLWGQEKENYPVTS